MSLYHGVPDAGLEQERSVDESVQQRPAKRMLSSRVLGALLGLTLFALYISVLAQNDIGNLLAAHISGLPAPRYIVPAIFVVIALGLSGTLAARHFAWSGWQLWRETSVRTWVGAHAVVLSVAAITVGAFAVRIFGISDNLPYINYPDEPAVADRALKILQTGDYNPHYFVYPSLYYYMQAGVYLVRFFGLVSSGKIVNLEGAQPTDFYLWGRILTSVLGALTVPLVYAAGRRLYGAILGTAVGLIGAVFMAASSLHIVFSQLITTDVPAAFFSALSFLMVARLLPEGASTGAQSRPLASYGRYIAAGAAIGLAISTKYNSALVILPFLMAHLYASWDVRNERLRAFLGPKLWVGLGATVVAFLVTTPFAIFDLPTFLNDVASVISHYNFGHLGHEGDDNWLFYIQSFLGTDTLPTILTLVGIAVGFARHRRADIITLAFPLAFYLSMSSYKVNFTRNLLPILPFTSILAALPLVLLWQWALRWWRAHPAVQRRAPAALATWVLTAIVALSVLPATQAAVQRGYRQSQPDTRVRASQWLDTHTRPGSKLWLEANGPLLTPNRYITAQGDHVTDHPMDWYVGNRFDYVVLNANAYKTIVYDQPKSDPPTRNAYLTFFQQDEHNLVASFDTNETDTPGPSIKIYRTGYAPPQRAEDVKAQHPVGATFHEIGGDQADVQLIGADYPDSIAAGSALPLLLYWSSDKQMSAAYTVFVHLVNKAGAVPVQRDTGPRNGTYPTSAWSAGEVVVDEAYLNLPQNLPPGEYTLRAGIYLQQNGAAVGAFTLGNAPSGGQDYAVIGPVTVTAHK